MAVLTVENNGSSTDPDFATTLVPLEARMPKFSLTMAWWALCSAMFYLVLSATLALNFGAMNAIAGMAAAVVVFGVINTIIARFAVRTGSSVALFSQLLFGTVGGSLATAILFLTAIYYAVFEGSVIAIAIDAMFSSLNLWQSYLIVVLYSVPLVFGGVSRWMDKLNGILLPFYVLGLVAALVLAISENGYSSAWLALGPRGDVLDERWWPCFTAFMGVWVIMMYTWDYARFGRPQDERYHGNFNFGLPFYICSFFLNGLIGIFLVATIKVDGALSETTIVYAILKLMGVWGLIFIWVSQTRINTANFQISTVNLQNFLTRTTGIRFSKVVSALLIGAIIFGLMLTNVFSFILQALAYQGIFVVAWVAMALTHMAMAWKRLGSSHDFLARLEKQPRFNAAGLGTWFASAVTGLVAIHYLPQFAAVLSAGTAVLLSLVTSRHDPWFDSTENKAQRV